MTEFLDQTTPEEYNLIWGEYDRLNKELDAQELEAGTERFNPVRFKRTYNVFRINHFANRIFTLTDKLELPTGSILHLLDDVSYPEDHQDVPRVDENIFLQNESLRKWIYHVKAPQVDGPINFNDKFIYRPSGLPSVFMKFRSTYSSEYKFCSTLQDLPTKMESLIVINHNPVLRTRFLGRLQYFRKMQLLWTSILNTAHSLMFLNKQQYILVPWGEEVFTRSEFLRSRDTLSQTTVKHPENWHYITMMHIANFMWDSATTSIFRQLPEEDLSKINLILQIRDKFVIYNLQDLTELNSKNRAYIKILNQMNMLSLAGRVDETASDDAKAAFKEIFSEEEPVAPETEEEDTPAAYILNKDTTITTTNNTILDEQKEESIIEKAARILPTNKILPNVSPVKGVVSNVKAVTSTAPQRDPEPAKTKTTPVTKPKVTTNSSKETDPVKVDTSTVDWVKELDTETEQFIDDVEFLTPAQKNRAKVLAKKYKTITLDGRKLEDILTEDTDLSIDDSILTNEMLGIDLPDQSGLKSSLQAYDQAYMKKTNLKHLVGVITSFQKNGVFLIGAKSNKVVTELNNYTDYSLQYEDIAGKKSVVKFRIPTVNRDGKVKIDGIQKVLKKQRINLPIVKINDLEVSLSSNYNKTRVMRNVTKAHSYFGFVDSLINDSSKSTAHITFGTCILHEFPLSYEYACLAERYKQVDFKTTDGNEISLFFDYPQRLEHFQAAYGDEDKLKFLESHYGTYCGHDKNVWLFVNNFNEVTAVKNTGGEVPENPYPTLWDVLKLSLKEGVKPKQLTEYTTIKILDKQLPVIFMLAYRYGLRNTLDYLGIDYTVTEGRTKTIVAESAVTGTESLNEYAQIGNSKEWLFHISPTLTAPTVTFTPQVPDVYEDAEDHTTPRVCVSTDIQGCLISTPAWNNMHERKDGGYTFSVYAIKRSAVPKSKLVTNEEIVNKKLVWDAHITDENWILGKITMRKIGQITAYPEKHRSISYQPLRRIPEMDTWPKDKQGNFLAEICDYEWTEGSDPNGGPDYVRAVEVGTESFELIPGMESVVGEGTTFNLVNRDDDSDITRLKNIVSSFKMTKRSLATIKSPTKFFETPTGSYLDAALAVSYLCFQQKIVSTFVFIQTDREDYACVLARANDSWYWLDSSWDMHQGVHGPYRTQEDAIENITQAWIDEYRNILTSRVVDRNVIRPFWEQETPTQEFLETVGDKRHFLYDKDVKKLSIDEGYIREIEYTDGRRVKITSQEYKQQLHEGKIVNIVKHPTPSDTVEIHEPIQTAGQEGFWDSVKRTFSGNFKVIYTLELSASRASVTRLQLFDTNTKELVVDKTFKYAEIRPWTSFDKPSPVIYHYFQEAVPKYCKEHFYSRGKYTVEPDAASLAALKKIHAYPSEKATKNDTSERRNQALKILQSTYAEFFKGSKNAEVREEIEENLDAYGSSWVNKETRFLVIFEAGGYLFEKASGRFGKTKAWDFILEFTKEWRNAVNPQLLKLGYKLMQVAGIAQLTLVPFTAGNASLNVIGLEDITEERKYTPKPGDIAIRFLDKTLWFNRYPLKNSLIVAGLDAYDLTSYEMSEFESKDIYYQLLLDKGMSINYLKGIDSFYDLFVDNITYSILKSMHEPTNVRDLLIRATEMLTTLDHRVPSSRVNHRIRGYEQFNAILYNEMSRQFAAYQSKRGKANKFVINPDAVYLRIAQNASMVPSESPNPLQDIKEQSYMTYAGIGGRTSESFVVNDRRYAKDDVGVISEATVDNNKVGINAQLSLDPAIVNTEGLLGETVDPQPANILSIYSLVFPFATQDDSKRMNFVSIQSSHWTPTVQTDRNRVRTGYERVVAHRCSKIFAGISEQDGTVTNIDEKTKLVTVEYKDGSRAVFPYGERYVPFQGFFATHRLENIVKVGQKLKKGDVVTYNKGFFNLDKRSKQLDMTTGVMANVALLEMDVNLEDALLISQRLGEKLSIEPTNTRSVILKKNSLVYKCVKVGDHVGTLDHLMIFEEDPGLGETIFDTVSEETQNLLGELNRRIPEAKYGGEIVKIEAHYGCPISEMHESLATIVRSAIAEQNRAAKLTAGTEDEEDYPPNEVLSDGLKYNGVQYDSDTVVLTFYIRETEGTKVGDKVVLSNQLKATISSVSQRPLYAEDGTELDVLFSNDSVSRRITLSQNFMGVLNRILPKMEQDVIDMYFNDK